MNLLINIVGVVASLLGMYTHYGSTTSKGWFNWFVVLFIINTTFLVLHLSKAITYV